MIKGFKAVEWMRKRREEIEEEDKKLDWKEKSSKTVELVRKDPLWKRFKDRRVKAGENLKPQRS